MYFINKNIAYQKYFGKIYVFDDVIQEAYILDEVSAFIWGALETVQEYGQLLKVLKIQYPEADVDVLDVDLQDFLNTLVETGLVIRDE